MSRISTIGLAPTLLNRSITAGGLSAASHSFQDFSIFPDGFDCIYLTFLLGSFGRYGISLLERNLDL